MTNFHLILNRYSLRTHDILITYLIYFKEFSMLSVRKLYWPAINIVGPGALKEAGAEIAKMGLKKALIVTDAVLNKLGVVKNVEDALN